MAISDIVLSIAQEIIVDVVKDIYKDKTLSNSLEKEFKKAIRKAIEKEIPYAKDEVIISAMTDDIFYACTGQDVTDFTLADIIKKTLSEYNDYNKNPQLLARGIASSLPMQIISSRDLNALIDTKLIFEILVKNKEILNELGIIKRNVSKFDNQTIREMLIEIIHLSKGLVDNEKKMEYNNKFIPEKYKEYFFNNLFLEETVKDNEIATLNDVYIKPHFEVLDYEERNQKVVSDNIISFIEDFAEVERRNKEYMPLVEFRNKNITTLFIKGHPGSGKSSLFYYLAYQKSHEAEFLTEYKVFFIKLIELYKENNNNLSEKNPLSDIAAHLSLPENNFNRTILVFDGLDEICTAKNINIHEYCENLIECTFKFEKFKIIITTRINYIDISNRENKNVLNIKLYNWSINDLCEWVDKYFKIHKDCDELAKIAKSNIDFLSTINNDEMLTILAVPLLFYMITSIGLDLNRLESIGQLYDKVFEELYLRNYNDNKNSALQRAGIIKVIPKEISRQIAIEIAYKMYQENELLLKVNSKQLSEAIIDALNYKAVVDIDIHSKRQIEKLFPITFFYKEVYDVVEFAHKSIMEFFCAEKLFQMLKSFEGHIADFIMEKLVKYLVSVEIIHFFIYFLENRSQEIELYRYEDDILTEFKKIIQGGDDILKLNKNIYGFELSKLIFKIYWIFIKDIIKCDNAEVNALLSNDYMKGYLSGILCFRNSKNIAFINNESYRWNFDGCIFKKFNFEYTDFRYFNLANAKFIDCNFNNVDFGGCVFQNTEVVGFQDFSFSKMDNVQINNLYAKNGKVYWNYVRVNNTVIENCDIRNWIIKNTIYTGEIVLKQTELLSSQVVKFLKGRSRFERVTINIENNIITDNDIENMKIDYREKKRKWSFLLEKYIEGFISRWEKKYMTKINSDESYTLSYNMDKIKKYVNSKMYDI